MPKPAPSSYPKEKRWRFVQRYINDKELISFASGIVKNHGKKIDDILPSLLSFIRIGKTDIKNCWLDIWVNLLHQMGLGYTWKKGKYLFATELSNFLYETRDIVAYYLYWALKFQFPFGFPKQKHYIDNKVAVQPIVLILEYFKELYINTGNLSELYITKYELVNYLMRHKNHDGISDNIKNILKFRKRHYDYQEEDSKTPGFIEAADHFFIRGKLFIQNVKLVKFDKDKIIIEDESHLEQIIKFLEFKSQPIKFYNNTQDMRNKYFTTVYNVLEPYPQVMSEELKLKREKRKKIVHIKKKKVKIEKIKVQKHIEITNPQNTTGTFTRRYAPSRKFQYQLRKDILSLYRGRCCICGLYMQEFLITSHIVAVELDPSIAADRSNCLLLCVFHDAAFETGIIYIDDNYTVQINKNYILKLDHSLIKKEILKRINQKITLPPKLKPRIDYLRRHRVAHNIKK